MVEIALPKNSRVTPSARPGRGRRRQDGFSEFRIYRWDPGRRPNPRIDTYFVNPAIAARWFSTAPDLDQVQVDPTLDVSAGPVARGYAAPAP